LIHHTKIEVALKQNLSLGFRVPFKQIKELHKGFKMLRQVTEYLYWTGIKKTLHRLYILLVYRMVDRLCGPVVRVLGYRSGGPGSIPGTTRKKKE
jgi:hypothetical protein